MVRCIITSSHVLLTRLQSLTARKPSPEGPEDVAPTSGRRFQISDQVKDLLTRESVK